MPSLILHRSNGESVVIKFPARGDKPAELVEIEFELATRSVLRLRCDVPNNVAVVTYRAGDPTPLSGPVPKPAARRRCRYCSALKDTERLALWLDGLVVELAWEPQACSAVRTRITAIEEIVVVRKEIMDDEAA